LIQLAEQSKTEQPTGPKLTLFKEQFVLKPAPLISTIVPPLIEPIFGVNDETLNSYSALTLDLLI
jgi:hypothetical protein